MTNVLMHESRRLVLPLETMVDALVEFDHVHKRWPERATLEGASLDPSRGIVLSLKQPGRDAPIEKTYSLAIIAAAIINYCAKMHVPIPRNASKSVAITSSGVAMTLEGTLFLQRQHNGLPEGYAANPPGPRPLPGSASESAEQPPRIAPDAPGAPEMSAGAQPEAAVSAEDGGAPGTNAG